MATTVRDLATAALQRLMVLAAGETASAEDAEAARLRLNDLLDSYLTQRLQLFTESRTTFTITAGQASYSVASRPIFLERVTWVDTTTTPTTERPLTLLTDAAWQRLPQKDLTGALPVRAYYTPTVPNGTLTLWPVPTSTTLQGVIYAPTPVSEYTTIDDTVVLPPGYRRMLIANLAVELAPDFERPVTADLLRVARESQAAVKSANLRLNDLMTLTPFTRGGTYDIYSDEHL